MTIASASVASGAGEGAREGVFVGELSLAGGVASAARELAAPFAEGAPEAEGNATTRSASRVGRVSMVVSVVGCAGARACESAPSAGQGDVKVGRRRERAAARIGGECATASNRHQLSGLPQSRVPMPQARRSPRTQWRERESRPTPLC